MLLTFMQHHRQLINIQRKLPDTNITVFSVENTAFKKSFKTNVGMLSFDAALAA